MAEVFDARQETLQRRVAVKALLGDLEKDTESTARFRREALTLATLHNENIVAVHDLVEKNGRLYLVLEFVDGVDLAVVLKNGPLPIDVALLVGVEVARALEHAHFRKVIHRDIKPANVMLSRKGQVKLTDFGIAKDPSKDDLTREGFIVGTPAYMSPEQLLGKPADWRSDIYALGALLFEALAGQRPFVAESQAELLFAVIKGRRSRLRQIAPQLPRSVEKIVERCMHIDPDQRYQRAVDVRRGFEKLLSIVLSGSASARVVAFLAERKHLGTTDYTVFDQGELEASAVVDQPLTVLDRSMVSAVDGDDRGRPNLLGRVWRLSVAALVGACFLGASVAVAYYLAPQQTQTLLQDVAALLNSTGIDTVLPSGESETISGEGR